MTIETYIELRGTHGKSVKEIQEDHHLSEATVLTFELSYTCYLNKVSLDSAIKLMSKIYSINLSTGTATFNPFEEVQKMEKRKKV